MWYRNKAKCLKMDPGKIPVRMVLDEKAPYSTAGEFLLKIFWKALNRMYLVSRRMDCVSII